MIDPRHVALLLQSQLMIYEMDRGGETIPPMVEIRIAAGKFSIHLNGRGRGSVSRSWLEMTLLDKFKQRVGPNQFTGDYNLDLDSLEKLVRQLLKAIKKNHPQTWHKIWLSTRRDPHGIHIIAPS